MCDVAEVKEALDWLERWPSARHGVETAPLVDAARRWVRMVSGLDYEAAARRFQQFDHPQKSWDETGDSVKDWYRQAARLAVDAAVGVEKEER